MLIHMLFWLWQHCLGKTSCSVPMHPDVFKNNDACPGVEKKLAIEVRCGRNKNH